MPQYTTTVTATSNLTPNTQDAFVEISLPAGNSARIKRVHASVESASQDTRSIVSLVRTSAAGVGGVGGVAVRRDAQTRATGATVTAKTTTTAFTVGAVVDTPWIENVNGRSVANLIPRNYMEEPVVQGGQRFVVALSCSAASIIHRVDVEWED